MTGSHADRGSRPLLPRVIRALSIPIILFWLAMAAVLNVISPQLETVTRENSLSLSPADAPSVTSMKHMGQKFNEFDSDSVMMIVIEGGKPLGDEAHKYYSRLVETLDRDTQHVQHVQDYWGSPVTAGGMQSEDGKAAYVQVNLAGNQGTTQGTESVDAVREIVANSGPPPGIKAYVGGAAALVADTNEAGDKSMVKMTVVTLIVIAVMLFLIYRSLVTAILTLGVVLAEMATARGVVAWLGDHHVMGLTVFVVSILTALAIAAGTDYFIFLLGGYHEARSSGQDKDAAYYTAIHRVGHVILGSGLTIAGVLLCLRFTRLNYFNTLAIPAALGMGVVLMMALTLGPAVLTVATSVGLLEAKRPMATRRWRRVGTVIARWPKPVLVSALVVVAVGIIILPSYRPAYDARLYIPDSVSSNVGYAAATRHFPGPRINPDLLMVEADHDLRNPRDMLVLDKIAKSVFHVRGIARVQSITRPLGPPVEHGSIPFQMSMQSTTLQESLQFLKARTGDIMNIVTDLDGMIAVMERIHGLMGQMADTTHDMTATMHDIQETTSEVRDRLADFDDFFRPLRNYFYWEPHCFDIPICWALRSITESVDGVDQLTEQTGTMLDHLDRMDALMPQLADQIPPLISIAKSMRATLFTTHSTFSAMLTQMDRLTDTATVMGQVFDEAKNDDLFYLPPDAFQSPDFQHSLKLMVSPDGKAARLTITHDTEPASLDGIAAVQDEFQAAKEAVKGTPLANAKFYLGGTAATYRDIDQAARYDLMIAGLSAIILTFIVMMLLTRAFVAALVIVGAVVLSLAASFGLSILIWQHILGVDLYWIVLPLAVIVLIAVASDYNLLFISRLKEEAPAAMNTALIRSFAGSGGVIMSAALVFAFTMISMITSDLRSIGQVGTTIGLGLLFDTFIVRSRVCCTDR
ncbi:RND family transporter [Mycobacterium sp. pUA109]|uniref:RND family transporter n=1 Tax=Mycobacterium sp. pUA109 TaxID=3238982 RepID=UPI00351B6F25